MKSYPIVMVFALLLVSDLRADDNSSAASGNRRSGEKVSQDRTPSGITSAKTYDPLAGVFRNRASSSDSGLFGPGASMEISGCVGFRVRSK
jgi:hypothetical protein